MIKYILLWFPMLIIAILNGMLRQFVFKRHINDLAAHQLSTVTLIIFFAIYVGSIVNWFPPSSVTQALLIGIIWMVMTLIFEFGFGLYRGTPWSKMLEDYNILNGHIWVLIPLFVAIAPVVFYKIRVS